MTTENPPSRKKTAWARAKELAARTPETRNRYADFLRAASITVVVIGHWLIAAARVENGQLKLGTCCGWHLGRSGSLGFFRSCPSSSSLEAIRTERLGRPPAGQARTTDSGWARG